MPTQDPADRMLTDLRLEVNDTYNMNIVVAWKNICPIYNAYVAAKNHT